MPAPPESSRRKEMRFALGGLKNQVAALKNHQLDMSPCMIPNVHVKPMVLDENSDSRPAFFNPYPAHLLPDPDDNFDQLNEGKYCDFNSVPEELREPRHCARDLVNYFLSYTSYHIHRHYHDENIPWSEISLGDFPFTDLYEIRPWFGPTSACQVKDGSSPHIKAAMYAALNGTDHQILRGELLLAIRLMFAQLRRSRFIQHMIAPVLLFSFMGPQHARVVEVHFDGHSLLVRPTKLYDLRTKDVAALKAFAQWYFGKPIGPTKT